MMFEEEDAMEVTAQELLKKTETLSKFITSEDLVDWYKESNRLPTFTGYGSLSRAISSRTKYSLLRGAKWDELFTLVDDITTFVLTEFQPQLQEWIDGTFSTTPPEDRMIKCEEIEHALTTLLAIPYTHRKPLNYMFIDKPWEFDSLPPTTIPSLLEKYNKLSSIALDCIGIFNTSGFIGNQWTRWVVIPFWYELSDESITSKYVLYPPQTILEQPYFKYVFNILSTNEIALLAFVRDGGLAWLYQMIINDFKWLEKNPEEAVKVRNFQFEKNEKIIEIMNIFITLSKNVDQGTYIVFIHLMGIIAWSTAYLSCLAVKAKDMAHPFDQYSNSLANYAFWCTNYCINSGYLTANKSILEQEFKKYNFWHSQICLSKNSIAYITPVYDLMKTEWYSSSEPSQMEFIEPSKMRPKLPDLTKMPEKWNDFATSRGLNSSQDSTMTTAYFNPRIEKARKLYEEGKVDPSDLISEWHRTPEVTCPENLFRRPDKQNLDIETISGATVSFVSGGSYDFCVKLVETNPDFKIKLISSTGPPPKTGEWKIASSFAKYRIKFVKTGSFDFSLKLDQ